MAGISFSTDFVKLSVLCPNYDTQVGDLLMRYKSILLLVTFLFSLLPSSSVQAEEVIQHSIDDAISLMYISDALLTDESELDDSPGSIGMLSPIQDVSLEADTNPLLARIIHAKKMQRSDQDANCQLLKAYCIG